MSLPPLTPAELLMLVVLFGLAAVLCIYLPVQIVSKVRRIRRKHHRITCRICGYRFIRRDKEATCIHCGARNR